MNDFFCWPNWMPLPERDTYNYDIVDRRLRTEMDIGDKIRTQFTTDETVFHVKLALNPIQSAWFETFERDIVCQGTQWFIMPLQTGTVIQNHLVRFKSRPQCSIQGIDITYYEFDLETTDRPYVMCPEITHLLTCVPPEDICESREKLHNALHIIIPSIELPKFNWDWY